ncbi:MAG: PilZ domain-containing protein, partial [Vicinamibacteria bacterium]
MRNHRVHPRFGPLVVKARFAAGEERREGYLTNLSVSGAFLAVDDPPPLGTDVDFIAILPWRLGELRAKARVVWRSVGARGSSRRLSGAGVAFTGLDAEAKERLDAYLARFVELAAMIEEME